MEKVTLYKRIWLDANTPYTSTFEMQLIEHGKRKGCVKVSTFGEADNVVKKHIPLYQSPASIVFGKEIPKLLNVELFKDLKSKGYTENEPEAIEITF